LLSARLGEQHVTSIEVDGTLADAARTTLKAAGWIPAVITGDGTEGWNPRAPYDRILSTATARHIPAAWIAQTLPGGLIVTPWGIGYSQHDAIAVRLIGGKPPRAARPVTTVPR
jgi:protein-L-isoaspartate O-methyltransferase